MEQLRGVFWEGAWLVCQGSKVGRKVQVGSRAQPSLSYILGKKSMVVTPFPPHTHTEGAEGIEGIEKKAESLVSAQQGSSQLCHSWLM